MLGFPLLPPRDFGVLPFPPPELELVQNAIFTDPTDQSTWVYLHCILSRGNLALAPTAGALTWSFLVPPECWDAL